MALGDELLVIFPSTAEVICLGRACVVLPPNGIDERMTCRAEAVLVQGSPASRAAQPFFSLLGLTMYDTGCPDSRPLDHSIRRTPSSPSRYLKET